MKRLPHILGVALALFLTLGLPSLYYVDFSALWGNTADAVTRATMELPEQPSGEFLVLLNSAAHPGDFSQWVDFFSDRDVDVIMSDVRCLTAEGDLTGIQLAERYRARLAENQMTLKQEQGVLLASKAEEGLFDTLILSREMAELLGLSDVSGKPGYTLITIQGG